MIDLVGAHLDTDVNNNLEWGRGGNRSGLSVDYVLNSRPIGPESLLNCSFRWSRVKDMGHGVSEPNHETLRTSLRPTKVMDRKQPCKGLRKEIRPQHRKTFKVTNFLRFQT